MLFVAALRRHDSLFFLVPYPEVADVLYERVVEAFGVLFVAVLLIVLASRLLGAHLAQPAARRTSAGDKVR